MIRSRITPKGRFRFRPLSVLGITATWAVLWGDIGPVVICSGILLAWLIDIVFPLPPIFWQGKFNPVRFLLLIVHELWDLVISSVRMIALAFAPKIRLNSGIIRVDLHSDDDLYQVAVATLVSLVPGTVVVEVVRRPRRLYLHVVDMDPHDPVGQINALVMGIERRVLLAFGTKAQVQQFESACLAPSGADVSDDWEVDA